MLRSDAPFYWPLRGSIALQNGSGTPTFTRATAKWMFNDEGKLIKLPSGAIEMRGYRSVINIAAQCSPPSSENFSAGWAKTGVTTPTANTIVVDGTTGSKFISINAAPTLTAGLTYCVTYRVQYVDIQYIQLFGQSGAFGTGIYCNFDLANGTANPTGCTATITAVSAGVWDVSITATATATAANAIVCIALVPALSSTRVASFVGDSVKSLIVNRYQIEDVTGQAVKTPSEYVSFGILSSPWHGAGATGVKFFATTKAGVAIPESSLVGAWLNPNSTTNNLLYCRDLTNAAWVKTNVTAALTQTGIDGQANASSLLTATANDATAIQTITAASAAGCSGYFVRRAAGTGGIYFTRDGGTNWADITSLINSSTPTLVKIENTSVTNPQVGFKIATSGDQIHVDAGINHLGTELANPILTTSAEVTVGNDPLTAPTAGNFSDTAGTILATVTRDDWAAGNGSAVGSSTRGLYTSSANSGAQGLDGTNTVNGPSGTPSGTMRIGIRWSGSSMQAFSDGAFGSVGSYDGAFNLASIAAMAGVRGGIKDVAIWPSSLSDADMISASKGMTFDGAVASLLLSAQNSVMTIGRTIEADAAQINLSAQNGERIIGRTIEANAASLSLSAQNSLMTIGRTIEANAASLSLSAQNSLMTIGRTIESDAAALTITAPDGRVLLDDSPKSTVTIAATLAIPTITARL